MATTDSTYLAIIDSGDYWSEVRVRINNVYYDQQKIYSMVTRRKLFKDNEPTIGCAVAGEIELSMTDPGVTFPKRAKIEPFYRVRNNQRSSSWIAKGVYYIDTREIDKDTGRIEIHGFDKMREAEQVYPSSTLTWSATSPQAYYVVNEIAGHLGVYIDSETIDLLRSKSYVVGFPAQYTMRETLGSIAAMYGGNFFMSDAGRLKLVGLIKGLGETFYLINEKGRCITFGGTRILLKGD